MMTLPVLLLMGLNKYAGQIMYTSAVINIVISQKKKKKKKKKKHHLKIQDNSNVTKGKM